jgi:hypothetical protein
MLPERLFSPDGRGGGQRRKKTNEKYGSSKAVPFSKSSPETDQRFSQRADQIGGGGTGEWMRSQIELYKKQYPLTHSGRMPTHQELWNYSQKLAKQALERNKPKHS